MTPTGPGCLPFNQVGLNQKLDKLLTTFLEHKCESEKTNQVLMNELSTIKEELSVMKQDKSIAVSRSSRVKVPPELSVHVLVCDV